MIASTPSRTKPAAQPPRPQEAQAALAARAGEPITILLVDDDPDCRMLVRDAIAGSKVSNRVYEVSNGKEALERYAGKDLNVTDLENDLTRFTGQGRFDLLGYENFSSPNGTGLRIRAHEKSYGPPFVDLALNVQGSGTGDFDFSAGFRVTMMDVRKHGGEWRIYHPLLPHIYA